MKSRTVTETIGVSGIMEGTGATHFCIMLAVFMTAVAAKKVALVEMNKTGCIRQAGIILEGFHARAGKLMRKVSIFTQTDEYSLSEIVSSGYDCVIIDFGVYDECNRASFLMCDRKIVVGSLSWWKIQHYVNFLASHKETKTACKWEYMAVTPVKAGIRYLRHTFGINVRIIPYEPDPFSLSGNTLDFMVDFFGKKFWK